MMLLDTSAVVKAVSGLVSSSSGVEHFTGVSTDTRTLAPGDLFVPLTGPSFDGHDFVKVARERGAKGTLWSSAKEPPQDFCVIKVSDTLCAYQDLATLRLREQGCRVVAITGSTGKTTTKELVAHLLSKKFCVHKTFANHNNDIGVPKTIFEMPLDTEWLVLEFGMRGAGEIERLARFVHPDVGVITNIGTSHIEFFDSQEGIARAKGELLGHLATKGLAVLPQQDPFFEFLSGLTQVKVCGYGSKASQEIEDFAPRQRSWEGEGFDLLLSDREGGCSTRLGLEGEHHLHDYMAGVAVARFAGLSWQEIDERTRELGELWQDSSRSRWLKIASLTVFEDAYNASLDSMLASFQVFFERSKGASSVAILGDMLELGEKSSLYHQELGRHLAGYPCLKVFYLGEFGQEVLKGLFSGGWRGKEDDFYRCENKREVLELLRGTLSGGEYLLFKGSRGFALETIVEELLHEQESFA